MYQAYILLYFALNIYPAWRTFQWLRIYFPDLNPVAYGIVFALLPIASVATFYSHKVPIRVKKVIDWVGGIFMLVFMFSFVFWLIIDIGRIILKHLDIDRTLFEKYGGIGVFVLTALIIIPGVVNYLKIRITSYKVSLNHKIDGGLRAVLISDVHLGAVNSERHIKKALDIINSQDADVVLIAGDMFNNNFNAIIDPEGTAKLLRGIKSKYGVFACLGNHDAGKTYPLMADFLKKSNIKLLNDEFISVDDRFKILGRIDPEPMGGFDEKTVRCSIDKLETENDFELPTIVLDHNPGKIGEYDGKYDLILCGHTHHGQMFPANFVTNMLFKVDYGYYREKPDMPAVIVSSGLGIWAMPFRSASVCEVVTIEID